MRCSDCVHYEVCKHKDYKEIGVLFTEKCDYFKPKSRFVELPCEVGDFVKLHGSEHIWKVTSISFYAEGEPKVSIKHGNVTNTGIFSWFKNYVKIVAKEEAEKALSERSK